MVLCIATTARSDARLQAYVRESEADWPFLVHVRAWSDLQLACTRFPDLLEQFWPSLAPPKVSISRIRDLILDSDPESFGKVFGDEHEIRYVFRHFGELDDFTAAQSGNPLFREQITVRDARGRIVERVETNSGVTKNYGYSYDRAGRLTDVRLDGFQSAHYDYDANGNRLARTTVGTTQSGTYDAQDRLATYGNATYTYTAAGELATQQIGANTT
jgi:YD repeat-containing protein